MSVLQDAWQAFVDKFKDDTEVNNFFSVNEQTMTSKNWTGNYIRFNLGNLANIRKAVPLQNQVEMIVSFQIISRSDDKDLIEKQFLKGFEIWINMVESKQTTQAWVDNIVKIDWEADEFERIDPKQISVGGTITFETQPYTAGSL